MFLIRQFAPRPIRKADTRMSYKNLISNHITLRPLSKFILVHFAVLF